MYRRNQRGPNYSTDYIKILDRKVLYTTPIFTHSVEFDKSLVPKKTTGGADQVFNFDNALQRIMANHISRTKLISVLADNFDPGVAAIVGRKLLMSKESHTSLIDYIDGMHKKFKVEKKDQVVYNKLLANSIGIVQNKKINSILILGGNSETKSIVTSMYPKASIIMNLDSAESKTVDLVIQLNYISRANDRQALLTKIKKLMSPNATLIFQEENLESIDEIALGNVALGILINSKPINFIPKSTAEALCSMFKYTAECYLEPTDNILQNYSMLFVNESE